MRNHLAPTFAALGISLLFLGACADGDAGAGGGGGLEPCTEDTTCTGNGGGDGDGDGDGGDATASTSTGDGGAPTGPSSTSSGSDATSSGEGGGTGGDAGVGGSGEGGGGEGGGGEALLVINEISAAGDDWIELFNAGDADLDVGGLLVADEDEPGVPNVAEAVVIPEDTTLGAGEYLFILADQDVASEGFVDTCEPGPAPCLVGTFGVTAGGDEIFVLDADEEVVLSAVYPADATVDGESWGRIPNGSGPFEVNEPTPGEENVAP